MSRGGATYYYVYNAHGDTVALTDATGAVVATYSYNAWGKVTGNTNPSLKNPFLYAGQYGIYYDQETGLYLMQTRYYNSDINRFISPDEFPGIVAQPITHNSYIYVNDNPTNNVDPDGHLFEGVKKFFGNVVKKGGAAASYLVKKGGELLSRAINLGGNLLATGLDYLGLHNSATTVRKNTSKASTYVSQGSSKAAAAIQTGSNNAGNAIIEAARREEERKAAEEKKRAEEEARKKAEEEAFKKAEKERKAREDAEAAKRRAEDDEKSWDQKASDWLWDHTVGFISGKPDNKGRTWADNFGSWLDDKIAKPVAGFTEKNLQKPFVNFIGDGPGPNASTGEQLSWALKSVAKTVGVSGVASFGLAFTGDAVAGGDMALYLASEKEMLVGRINSIMTNVPLNLAALEYTNPEFAGPIAGGSLGLIETIVSDTSKGKFSGLPNYANNILLGATAGRFGGLSSVTFSEANSEVYKMGYSEEHPIKYEVMTIGQILTSKLVPKLVSH